MLLIYPFQNKSSKSNNSDNEVEENNNVNIDLTKEDNKSTDIPVINIIESSPPESPPIFDVIVKNINSSVNTLSVIQYNDIEEKPIEEPLYEIPIINANNENNKESRNEQELHGLSNGQAQENSSQASEGNFQNKISQSLSGMSFKVLLAQIEAKVKPMVNDIIYPIIQNFIDSSRDTNLQIESKIKDLSDKIDFCISESNQMTDMKISALDEQLTSEYQNLINLKTRECQIEAQSYINAVKQDLDFKMEKVEKNSEITTQKFEMQVKNIYEDFRAKIDEEVKRRIRDKRELANQFTSIKENTDKCLMQSQLIEKGIINVGEVIGGIIEIMQIQSCLDEQDEKDRKSVSLWGINQKFPHKTEDYYKSIPNIRKSTNGDKLKLSNVLNLNRNYNIITIDK